MKELFEKLKDLLYDSIDYIIMLGIIGVVVFIIGWRLDLLFANEVEDVTPTNNIVAEDDYEKKPGNEEDIPPIKEEEHEEILTVSIPSGSTSNSIGTILESNGLISNKNDFIDKCEEMQLSNKLKAGNYDIESGSSLETILGILTK